MNQEQANGHGHHCRSNPPPPRLVLPPVSRTAVPCSLFFLVLLPISFLLAGAPPAGTSLLASRSWTSPMCSCVGSSSCREEWMPQSWNSPSLLSFRQLSVRV
ncbi:uncharacterized protein LOC123431212 [Hordeum vulgare subsp. vulgare]|uniref:uncharacterized protein LOC123431209 n=1 Tax=Hordeum vulgare subsp. vulgare TaxID=112509 RepID=UPI001D1A35D0|nr:uncharacterized protein LOC123431209 [Hordeum vulgare subsp. vulgare]XP_044970973.1 uncharacterized protein LOC123431211 [Hordeum vulgare subsp. vulgare]XP_044970974.1 uncharacterized protein LOC123431212 [Hordeum vulgare subsp. vulgare]